MTPCLIGLGSNLDQPVEHVRRALRELAALTDSRLVRHSPLYRSAPIGPQDQDDFINAVALVETNLPPSSLLQALQALEQQHRRIRERHWGPRTLDLDILTYGDLIIDQPDLKIPHPHMTSRAFVLRPLLDIAPTQTLPDGRRLADLLPNVAGQAIEAFING